MALHIKALKVPAPLRQYPFSEALGRKHRFDFCWPDRALAVEIDGAVHRIRERFRDDVERQNIAQLLGWKVLRFTPADVRSGKAIDVLVALFAGDDYAALEAAQRPTVGSGRRRKGAGCST